MSKLKKTPAPKQWTQVARDWIVDGGGVGETAKRIGVAACTVSLWHNGNERPGRKRVDQIITLALQDGVCLTPADLGRPDLAKKTQP